MIDDGKVDYKLISVVDCDPRYDNVSELSDLPVFELEEIENFFQNYKVLQGIKVETGGYHHRHSAAKIIEECREAYIEAQQK